MLLIATAIGGYICNTTNDNSAYLRVTYREDSFNQKKKENICFEIIAWLFFWLLRFAVEIKNRNTPKPEKSVNSRRRETLILLFLLFLFIWQQRQHSKHHGVWTERRHKRSSFGAQALRQRVRLLRDGGQHESLLQVLQRPPRQGGTSGLCKGSCRGIS